MPFNWKTWLLVCLLASKMIVSTGKSAAAASTNPDLIEYKTKLPAEQHKPSVYHTAGEKIECSREPTTIEGQTHLRKVRLDKKKCEGWFSTSYHPRDISKGITHSPQLLDVAARCKAAVDLSVDRPHMDRIDPAWSISAQ